MGGKVYLYMCNSANVSRLQVLRRIVGRKWPVCGEVSGARGAMTYRWQSSILFETNLLKTYVVVDWLYTVTRDFKQ